MKKLLLGLGSIAAVIAPVVAVISCSDSTDMEWAVGTPLETGKQTTLKAAANTALGMNSSDIDSVSKITNYTFTTTISEGAKFVKKTFTFKNAIIYNLKSSSTSFKIDYGSGANNISTNGGGQIIIGMSELSARAAATVPHFYILMKYGLPAIGGSNKWLNEVTNSNKITAIKTSILEPVFA